MAEGKNSFILYADMLPTVEKLTDKRAGILFKTILRYVNDKNPEITDVIVDIVFESVKQNLKRDLKKWEAERSKKSEAGKKGGIKSGESRRKRSKRSNASKNEANEAVNVIVNDSVTVKEREERSAHLGVVVYDAETEILKNQIQFEQICVKTGTIISNAKESLRKYHLYLEEKEQYPKGKKAVFAGFEKWLLNEKRFNNGSVVNNDHVQSNIKQQKTKAILKEIHGEK